MMTATYLGQTFAAALDYASYLETGTDEQRTRWKQVHDRSTLTDPQKHLVASFTRRMNVLVVSGIWCGDCVQQVPLFQSIAQANATAIDLRILDRDLHKDLSDQLKVNGGGRVPVVLFLAEDFEFCALAGDRTLSRYRAIARKQLGPSCSTGVVVPDAEELAATLADWLGEFERVQLMLRLSPRLRKTHGD